MFQKSEWHRLSQGRVISADEINRVHTGCSINIVELSLEDHGVWKCFATEDPFAKSNHYVEANVEVT
jgi:hypothetical protein